MVMMMTTMAMAMASGEDDIMHVPTDCPAPRDQFDDELP